MKGTIFVAIVGATLIALSGGQTFAAINGPGRTTYDTVSRQERPTLANHLVPGDHLGIDFYDMPGLSQPEGQVTHYHNSENFPCKLFSCLIFQCINCSWL